jgi:DnaJ-class molecular chaperone
MIDNAYQVLGLRPDADEAEIRQRYLALVRQFPPERDPQRFAEIRAAYDRLRDPITSLEQRLFSLTTSDTFESLVAAQQAALGRQRIPTGVLLSLADE